MSCNEYECRTKEEEQRGRWGVGFRDVGLGWMKI